MITVYVDRKDIELIVKNKSLQFKSSTIRRSSVPLAQIDRLVIRGNANFSTSLLGILANYGIGILVLSGRNNRYLASFVGRPHNDVTRRLGQFEIYSNTDERLSWSRRLITSKIQAQLRLLSKARNQRPDKHRELTKGINALQAALDSASSPTELTSIPQLLGIEGNAARQYYAGFSSLFADSLKFKNRNRRPPRDPVNSCLSLGYTLLHHEVVLACYGAGLDPMLGICHKPKYGRESLACDIAEPIRPSIDEWVWDQFRSRTLTTSCFTTDKGAVYLTKTGRQIFYKQFNPLQKSIYRLLRVHMLTVVREFEQKPKSKSISN